MIQVGVRELEPYDAIVPPHRRRNDWTRCVERKLRRPAAARGSGWPRLAR